MKHEEKLHKKNEKCYIISCDIATRGDYDALRDAIKKYRTWAHITKSTWAVVTAKSATEITDDLWRHIEGSRLFVVKSNVQAEAAGWNVFCSHEWLERNL